MRSKLWPGGVAGGDGSDDSKSASHGPALNPDLVSVPLDAALCRWPVSTRPYDGQLHLRCEYSIVVVESV